MHNIGNFNSNDILNSKELLEVVYSAINGESLEKILYTLNALAYKNNGEINSVDSIKSLDELNIGGTLYLKNIAFALPENGISSIYVNITDDSWKGVFPYNSGILFALSKGMFLGTTSLLIFADSNANMYAFGYYQSRSDGSWVNLNPYFNSYGGTPLIGDAEERSGLYSNGRLLVTIKNYTINTNVPINTKTDFMTIALEWGVPVSDVIPVMFTVNSTKLVTGILEINANYTAKLTVINEPLSNGDIINNMKFMVNTSGILSQIVKYPE